MYSGVRIATSDNVRRTEQREVCLGKAYTTDRDHENNRSLTALRFRRLAALCDKFVNRPMSA